VSPRLEVLLGRPVLEHQGTHRRERRLLVDKVQLGQKFHCLPHLRLQQQLQQVLQQVPQQVLQQVLQELVLKSSSLE